MATIPSPLTAPVSPAAHKRIIPPLAQGDRLTSRAGISSGSYAAMPPKVKAERIEGMVYMPASAVSAGFHGDPHAKVIGWLTNYESATPGVVASDNSTVALDLG